MTNYYYLGGLVLAAILCILIIRHLIKSEERRQDELNQQRMNC